jgi:thiol:disulfide interchange protein DsbA
LWAAPAAANDPMFAGGEFTPWVELTAAQRASAPGLERRVVVFVHFTCPFCRAIHPSLTRWSKGLPAGITYEVVPAVGLPSHAPMALAYYTVLEVAPGKLDAYVQQLFVSLQDENQPAESAETYIEAASRIGIPRETFLRATQSENVRRFAMRAQALTASYGLNEVPSVVVGNRYLTAPRRVQNQPEAFLAVLNGLVSSVYTASTGARGQ